MSVRKYLPSTQFSVMFFALALSAGLVFAADQVTKPTQASLATTNTPSVPTSGGKDWESTLYAIQAQNSSSLLPEPPDQNVVDSLRQAAQSTNVTDSVGKTLLVNLTNANTQGLGADIPTQNQLIASALQQIKSGAVVNAKTYTLDDLVAVADTAASLRAYGIAVEGVLASHPEASMGKTLIILGNYINGTANQLSQLAAIQKEYSLLAKDLSNTPVPQSLTPFHLQMVTGFEQMAQTYPNMQSISGDPLRGLAGLQQYNSIKDTQQSVFINIAQVLNKDGILFSKDGQGALWNALLSQQQ